MSISCKDIAESFKGFKVKAITQGAFGSVYVWNTSKVEYCCAWGWELTNILEKSRNYPLGRLEITEFVGKKPEECIYIVEEPVDYSKWIGRVCWFWNGYEGEDEALGILEAVSVDNKGNQLFKDLNCGEYYHCRPAKLHEVKFVKEY